MRSEAELNEKLAKWAEMERLIEYYKTSSIIPNDAYFTQSLDACFKWLVPKLKYLSILYDSRLGYLVSAECNEVLETSDAKTPALALCRAIEQLVDSEEK